ncbi:hypothetical protein DPMN_152389 [Dreissena polymorpha]|uniref:T-cell immunomodulatory protein TIP C2 domain-containing protein n=1 Tax=Dreissena polymorpha TaxID=45954 RepID=A0A9D4J3T9_DREPO|nr:hypothetical protein DPMN_061646 [Dreissena polymorpha]KAH3798786.1 hypothetical protein DPMN_152389 [Dreissena polymorpha]
MRLSSFPAYQLSQSAYLPLQLPYNVFGLGQAPNFVDSLQVGIATNTTVSCHFRKMTIA